MENQFVFEQMDIVLCVEAGPLKYPDTPENTPKSRWPKPPLKNKGLYLVNKITIDSKGNQHLDVGLLCSLNFVRSLETQDILPGSDVTHWCHPSRFIFLKRLGPEFLEEINSKNLLS